MTPQTVVLLSFALSAVGALAVAPLVIKGLKRLKAGQTVLGYVTQHEHKTGTPTMGGVIFLLPVTVVCLVTMTAFSVLAMCLTLGFAVLGFLDDFIKVRFHRNLGLKAYQKIIGQVGLAAIAAYFCFASPTVGTAISIPAQGAGEMGWGIIPFVMLVYIATTNSVNLTDGLDGLAATTSLGYFAVYTLLVLGLTHDAASAGNHADASELGSLAAFSASVAGGLAGYLVFNANPARVMMGDTGSLALGAAAATMACFSRTELLLPLAGIMFVWSSISVILQVLVFKAGGGRRLFLMAPFHHHLEMKGLSEARICALYLVITLIAGALTLILARAV